jgi:hypothetical protein
MLDSAQSFVSRSTWILEHSDDYIVCGWKVLWIVAFVEFAAAVLLIAARALVGDTNSAASKYDCEFVQRDIYLVAVENPAGSDGTCRESLAYLMRGNNASIVSIISVLLSMVLDMWTPARKLEHGFCEFTRLNFMCGEYCR